MPTPLPVVLGNVMLSNGKLAVLAGNQVSSGGFTAFDQLQVVILGNSTPVTLDQNTGLGFPLLGSPDRGFQNPELGGGTIAALPGGGMAIETWGDSNDEYYLQILDNTGAVTKAPFPVHSQATTGGDPLGNPLGAVGAWSGGIVVAYSTNNGQGLFFQRYSNAGVAIDTAVTVAAVTSGTTGWSGSMSVNSLGDVIFGLGAADIFTAGTYAEYNSADALVASASVAQLSSGPKFSALSGGGFITAGYTNSGPYSGSYPGFDLKVQTVSAVGIINTTLTVPNASGAGQQAAINWINTTANGTVEFQEFGATTTADIYAIGTGALSRNVVTLPTLGYAVPPVANVSGGTLAGVGINSSNQLVGENIGCLVTGTEIATADGPCLVEALQVGDLVLTESGEARPVRWIGRRFIDITRHPRPETVRPVRISAGTFGPGRPSRDLFVSPDHSVWVDGAESDAAVLVPAGRLANGDSISAVDIATVTYWHIELDTHDVILAEGLPVESYLDDGRRDNFENSGAPMRLHPDFSPRVSNAQRWEVAGCARLVMTGPLLEAARLRAGRGLPKAAVGRGRKKGIKAGLARRSA